MPSLTFNASLDSSTALFSNQRLALRSCHTALLLFVYKNRLHTISNKAPKHMALFSLWADSTKFDNINKMFPPEQSSEL